MSRTDVGLFSPQSACYETQTGYNLRCGTWAWGTSHTRKSLVGGFIGEILPGIWKEQTRAAESDHEIQHAKRVSEVRRL